jgi:mannose-6-phosphate isomerase
MLTLDGPLQLSCVFKPKIWGRNDLSPLFPPAKRPHGPRPASDGPGLRLPDPAGPGELMGEVWITDDTSRFLNGPVAGMTLSEASEKYGPELNGRAWRGQRFPILAKYIFTSDWLSVQVHPDDEYARAHEPGDVGKCEMWYILHSDPGAEILLGLKPGVTKEQLKEAAERGKSKELLKSFRPKDGEAIYVPPGTVHALGPGVVLFEAEENCDLTYRLDDFGRVGLDGKPRPLHWEKGLEVIRPALPALRDLPRLEFREPYGARRYVLACRFFAVEELQLKRLGKFESSPEHVEVFSVLKGEGRVENRAGWLGYRRGGTWLIPPSAGQYRLVPAEDTSLLKFYVPDLERDFRRPLAQRWVRAAEMKGVVFE